MCVYKCFFQKIYWKKRDALTPRAPLLCLPPSRMHTHTHTHTHRHLDVICCGTGQKSQNMHLAPLPCWTFASKQPTAVPSISARGRPSLRARACRSLSASPSIQQPPYSRHLHIFIMQNANAVVFLILTKSLHFGEKKVFLIVHPNEAHIDFTLMMSFCDNFIISLANHCETLRTEGKLELPLRRKMNADQESINSERKEKSYQSSPKG